ncbi:hypothetical protein BX070DRAFT_236118 [Coemansia spiralis]|uniref:26S proteasome complex subunit SEM1 n=1 Tax=Coemansia umbellata TaxID=1424467 RepID=A0ABQ8PUC7_9FUNG|nr:hypothetical protein BX070DRAFT_236118 [Coemansia spiralis]KAJ1995845.1 hypothetical protein EDC05_000503 [Coemansia umbellata]
MSTIQNAQTDEKKEQTQAGTDAAAQQAPVANVLEEDDEFEEFKVEVVRTKKPLDKHKTKYGLTNYLLLKPYNLDWNQDDEDKDDAALWDDNWDDDDLEDDFSKQLRVELEKASQPEAMAISN